MPDAGEGGESETGRANNRSTAVAGKADVIKIRHAISTRLSR